MAFRFKNQKTKSSSIYSSPFHQMENPPLLSLLQRTTTHHNCTTTTTNTNTNTNTNTKKSRKSSSSTSGGIFRMFKLLPMLTTGCKMVALLGGRPRNKMLTDKATTITLFGYKKGRVSLAIQEDPHRPPIFVIELPMLTGAFHKEMASDIVRLALESETKTHKKKVLEEFVWAVYCNGRKFGYSIRRTKNMSEDETHVMQLLRGVSMGAGVLSCPVHDEKENRGVDGEMTYIRARFDRVVGSKDSEAFYMINPDGASGQELSIFFVRVH
ncbi:protein MIZU-KUSSEI 1 [Lycium ferocissimum]|uniref:protein MIZU-KUSSEI 1 n=1 Tax=Lycium ferocissimum TaxID=112874 RepID=UPI0028165857|nr:protein MIZU-KUSSEI 1 [Lycium ferocissimum]